MSKTDLKGRITYSNRAFMRIAGYEEHELLGIQHNIVRHPDMPRAVFFLLWQTIQSGREFLGYVKNMTKSGDFYWVLATVSPSVDADGNLIGYTSMRRTPRRNAVEAIQFFYQDMLEEERRVGAKEGMEAAVAKLQQSLGKVPYEKFVLSL